MDSQAVGYLEISANVMTTVAILLAGRNSIHTWWRGIVGCLLFCFLFYQSQLYADVVLQMFFIVTSMVGWWGWRRGHQGQSLPISHIDLRKSLWLVQFGLLATGAYGLLLHYFTDAYAPFIDSAVLVFSIIAQVLLMQRRVENWVFWLIVNSIAAPLYASRELYLTAFLYVAYWINALVSWRSWREMARISSDSAK